MIKVIPAILANNFKELNEKIAKYANIVSTIQIDICDGNFVPSVSWPMNQKDKKNVESILNEEEGLPYWDKIDFEFDLMIKNAHTKFEFFTRLGAKRIIFHYEAEENKDEFKGFLEGLDMYTRENFEIGLAINTTTNINELKTFVFSVDFVQCMGIERIGFQGEKFDERVLKQISSLRQEYPELVISVDGSVNKNTAGALVLAGANHLIIGSALEESLDPRGSIEYFENL